MVTKWGLSEKLGPMTYGEEDGEVFLGRSMTQRQEVSDETNQLIDLEVRAIIDRTYTAAKDVLEANMDKLHKMAEALIKYETIDDTQIKEIMDGKEPSPPEGWEDVMKDASDQNISGDSSQADMSATDKA